MSEQSQNKFLNARYDTENERMDWGSKEKAETEKGLEAEEKDFSEKDLESVAHEMTQDFANETSAKVDSFEQLNGKDTLTQDESNELDSFDKEMEEAESELKADLNKAEVGGFDVKKTEEKEDSENVVSKSNQQLSNHWQKLVSLANSPDASSSQIDESVNELIKNLQDKGLYESLDKDMSLADVEERGEALLDLKSALGKFEANKDLPRDVRNKLDQSLDSVYGNIKTALRHMDEIHYQKKQEYRKSEEQQEQEVIKGELPQRFENLDFAVRGLANVVRVQRENGFAEGLDSDKLSGALYRLGETLRQSNPDAEEIAQAIGSLSESILQEGEAGLPRNGAEDYFETVNKLMYQLNAVRDSILQLKSSKLVEGPDGEKILNSLLKLDNAVERKWYQQSSLRNRLDNYLSGGY